MSICFWRKSLTRMNVEVKNAIRLVIFFNVHTISANNRSKAHFLKTGYQSNKNVFGSMVSAIYKSFPKI